MFVQVRLYLMYFHHLSNYTMIFFTCKNGLIIALQTYRCGLFSKTFFETNKISAFVLITDRYMPKKEKKQPKSKETPPKPRKRRATRSELR